MLTIRHIIEYRRTEQNRIIIMQIYGEYSYSVQIFHIVFFFKFQN